MQEIFFRQLFFVSMQIRRQPFGVYSDVDETLDAAYESWIDFRPLDGQNCARHDRRRGCAG
jgi:hypothetical protein